MNTDLEVSVVLAVRDGGHEALPSAESILAQEGVALELVLVDDGSEKPTADLLADLATRDERIRLFRRERRGLTRALASGCAEARAPLVARQDAGDLSHPDRLARQVDLLRRHPSVVLASCWTACVGPAGEPLYVERNGGEPGIELELGHDSGPDTEAGPTSHGSVLFRREAYIAVGGYRREFALAQDWDLWYRLGHVGRFALLGETLYLRRLQPRSLTFAAHDLQREYREIARAAARRNLAGASEADLLTRAAALGARFERERGRRLGRAEALGRYHLGALLRAQGDRRAAGYFAGALRHRPWFARAWVRWIQATVAAGSPCPPAGFESPEALHLLGALPAFSGAGA